MYLLVKLNEKYLMEQPVLYILHMSLGNNLDNRGTNNFNKLLLSLILPLTHPTYEIPTSIQHRNHLTKLVLSK